MKLELDWLDAPGVQEDAARPRRRRGPSSSSRCPGSRYWSSSMSGTAGCGCERRPNHWETRSRRSRSAVAGGLRARAQDRLRSAAELATGVDAVHVRARGGATVRRDDLGHQAGSDFSARALAAPRLFAGGAGVFADSSLLGSRFSEANAFAVELVAPVENLRDLPTGREPARARGAGGKRVTKASASLRGNPRSGSA